jgi:hypothetical protein
VAKTKVNKAAEIRAYFAEHPTASGPDVVTAMGKKGIKVSLPQVYNAKASGKSKRKRKSKAMSVMNRVRPNDVQNIGTRSLHVIEAAFTMLEHLTVDSAKAILDRLSGGKRKAK